MESTTDYFVRKQSEIDYLNSRLTNALDIPKAKHVIDIIHAKKKLKIAQFEEAVCRHQELSETRFIDHPILFYDYEISYFYQRWNMKINAPPIYREAFTSISLRDAIRRDVFTSSGMSAISTLAMALTQQLKNRYRIIMANDTYTETYDLFMYLATKMQVTLTQPQQTIENTLSSMADQRTVPLILFIDSFCSLRHWDCLHNMDRYGADLVIFDTTCLDAASPDIGIVVESALKKRIPLVMVRSHIKLDSLGFEYARLGSAVFVSPTLSEHLRIEFFKSLFHSFESLQRLLGTAPVPYHLLPFNYDNQFRSLNSERINRLMACNEYVGKSLQTHLGAFSGRIITYHHKMFLRLWLDTPVTASTGQRQREALIQKINAVHLPVRFGTSFGFDFMTIDHYVGEEKPYHTLRISVGDLPTLLLDEFIDIVVDWQQEMTA